MTTHKKLLPATLLRLQRIGVDLRSVPFSWLQRLQDGRSMMVVVNHLPCTQCGENHRTAISMVRPCKGHPRRLFRK